jgi:hypothetical protein
MGGDGVPATGARVASLAPEGTLGGVAQVVGRVSAGKEGGIEGRVVGDREEEDISTEV